MKHHTHHPRSAAAATCVIAVVMALSLTGCGPVDATAPAASAASSRPAESAVSVPAAAAASAAATATAGKSSSAAETRAKVPTSKSKAPKTRSKAVPAPSDGTIRDKVERQKKGPAKRAKLDAEVSLPGGVHLQVTKIKPFTAKAETPGEVTGPALAVSVRLTNETTDPINVDSTIVTLTEAGGDPAQPTTSEPYQPFSGEISVGDSGTGTYVFLIPKKHRKQLTIAVEYRAGQSIAEFVGSTS